MRILILFSLISVVSCTNDKPKSVNETIDFGSFTIEAPSSWSKKEGRGIDSYIGKLLIDSSESIEFDLGAYSNDLTEYMEVKMSDGKTYVISANDTSYSPALVDINNASSIIKSKVTWDTIDGRLAKISIPINPGIGTTGIYFDSLWGNGRERVRFNLYGVDLKPTNQKKVLNSFKTLRFYKPK